VATYSIGSISCNKQQQLIISGINNGGINGSGKIISAAA